MKDILGIKGLAITEYAIAANADLGIRDSGKTYTATKATEELFDAGIPSIWLDPIGVAHNLRIPGKGKGYPVVVAGGKHGDLPLTTKNVGAIVRAAMENGVSLVLDLFSVELSKADWRRIVKETCEILLHENQEFGLRHVFIEEAAEFVPQRPQDMQVFSAVEKLVRMGGNSKVGITLINQRSADLNKSVLELCANVLVHRQRGKNTILDLKKWLSLTDPETEKKITASLPDLESGHCWVMSNDLKKPVLIQVPQKNSLHPDRRAAAPTKAEAAKRKPVDAGAFVAAMKEKLEKKAAPAPVGHAKPGKGKPEILTRGTVVVDQEEIKRISTEMFGRGKAEGLKAAYPRGFADGFEKAKEMIWDAVLGMSSRITDDYRRQGFKMPKIIIPADLGGGTAPNPVKTSQNPPSSPPRAAAAPRSDAPIPGLGKAERAIVGVLANFPEDGAAKTKVALMAGYSAGGGGFNNALSSLRSQGLLQPNSDPLRLTHAGLDAAGEATPLPSGHALLDYWMAHKALGKAEGMILEVLVKALPSGLTKEEVADRTSYQAGGGGFNNALSRLRTLELISGRGELRAAEEFA